MDKEQLIRRLGTTIATSKKTGNKHFVLRLDPEFVEQDKALIVVRMNKEKFTQSALKDGNFFLRFMQEHFNAEYSQQEVESGVSEETIYVYARVDDTLIDLLEKMEQDELIDHFYFEFRKIILPAEGF